MLEEVKVVELGVSINNAESPHLTHFLCRNIINHPHMMISSSHLMTHYI